MIALIKKLGISEIIKTIALHLVITLKYMSEEM